MSVRLDGQGWSLQPALWTEALDRNAERPWTRRMLDIDEVMHIPPSSGVYVICATPASPTSSGLFGQLYNAVYVGRGNLRDRFKKHAVRSDRPGVERAKQCFVSLHFWFAEVNAQQSRTAEARLIAALRPSGNDRQEGRRTIAAIIKRSVPAGGV